MEDTLATVEGPSTSETTTLDQIDQEFSTKTCVWDFNEMSREEYLHKDDIQKQSLILKFYNDMVKGKS